MGETDGRTAERRFDDLRGELNEWAGQLQRMVEQAQALSEGRGSEVIKLIAKGEGLALNLCLAALREILEPSVGHSVDIRVDALAVQYDSHVRMLSVLASDEKGKGAE